MVSSLRHAQEQASDVATTQIAMARQWVAGVAIDWNGLHAGERRRRVALPGYPFERQRYWVSPDKYSRTQTKRALAQVERPFSTWFQAPSWKRSQLAATGRPLDRVAGA